MELIRKLVRVGTSRAVVIPANYIESIEKKGKKFTKVKMTLNDKIVLEPILEKE